MSDTRMTEAEWAAVLAEAAAIGRRHGKNAAGWYEQDSVGGRVTRGHEENARRILAGIEDVDPEILDGFPSPDLSGQWADGYSSRDLEADLGIEDGDDDAMEACDAYEDAFREACEAAIAEACRRVLAD